MIKLAEISGQLAQRVYRKSGRLDELVNSISDVLDQLKDWKDEIPQNLRYSSLDVREPVTKHKLCLHMLYNQVGVLGHTHERAADKKYRLISSPQGQCYSTPIIDKLVLLEPTDTKYH